VKKIAYVTGWFSFLLSTPYVVLYAIDILAGNPMNAIGNAIGIAWLVTAICVYFSWQEDI